MENLKKLEELKTLYVRRELNGFEFKSNSNIAYDSQMNKVIGKKGIIVDVDTLADNIYCFDVDFGTKVIWSYPFDEALDHLVPETPIDLNLLFEQIKSI